MNCFSLLVCRSEKKKLKQLNEEINGKEKFNSREEKRKKLFEKYAKNCGKNLKQKVIMKLFRNYLEILLLSGSTTGVCLQEEPEVFTENSVYQDSF
jgi:hypothetical protein